MSIEIVGSNDQKLKLITENYIDSIIQNQEILYNLYKNKYLVKIQNKSYCNKLKDDNSNHLLKQLIKTFYKYDSNKEFIYNINEFNKFLFSLNNNNNSINFINTFLITHNLLNNLNSSINKLLIKIFENKYKKK